MVAACYSEISVIFNGLHGVISQKIEVFVTTAVRTSTPTNINYLLPLNDFF
jgi:hypothetical protein